MKSWFMPARPVHFRTLVDCFFGFVSFEDFDPFLGTEFAVSVAEGFHAGKGLPF